ncbi:hypothetical protein TREMEDRAFT_16478, partial [Tremella mesenterica DSM 1558]|uniref:uncharacterized protein n=1 Tax=Tremella mesenterica (strain ATCC 24925 / CBS 8224 / DSM 1558 / NBRC 9311 / NRRL Y-6157 / RJB 2259-6 / UBC 559-6) TaxID=578456 RepID=UPI0003F4A0E2
PDEYVSQSLWLPCGARGVFGGQVIAQALSAAGHTVAPSLGLHSQHCYFVLPAAADTHIYYLVEKVRDGRSYSTRLVKAKQSEKVVFILIASYTSPPSPQISQKFPSSRQESISPEDEVKMSHSLRFSLTNKGSIEQNKSRRKSSRIPSFQPRFQIPGPDDIVAWEESEEEENRWQRVLDTRGSAIVGKYRTALEEYIKERRESPVSLTVARRKGKRGDVELDRSVRMLWLKARLRPGEEPSEEIIKIMIAYMSDFQFIGTAARSVGLSRASSPRLGMLASLDHSIHFYPFPERFRADEPLLHVMESALADVGSGRGVVRGTIYTQRGVLIATTLQEGVMRVDSKGREKGLVEGGV